MLTPPRWHIYMYKVNKLVSFFSPSRGQGSRDSLTQESFTLNKLPKVYTHTKKKKKKKKKKKEEEEDKRGQGEKL